MRGRFAPSTTGPPHPGTLLAALLCWLDARSRGGEVLLRLEDLDPERSRAEFFDGLVRGLDWFGLDWDGVTRQSDSIARYEAKLEALAEEGRLYACDCSRSEIRKAGQRAPDGSFRYPGTCRRARVSKADLHASDLPLRIELDTGHVVLRDESGLDLSGNSAELFGDPVVRRRDGAYAYHFVSVLDDDATGVDRIVRGRDLAPSTILQTALRTSFGLSVPAYRHHALLLEPHGEKFSKLHGAVDLEQLRSKYDAPALCGRLAGLIGLGPTGPTENRCEPRELVAEFDWSRVATQDVPLSWSERDGLTKIDRPAKPA